jgi:hypothetical protein
MSTGLQRRDDLEASLFPTGPPLNTIHRIEHQSEVGFPIDHEPLEYSVQAGTSPLEIIEPTRNPRRYKASVL